MAEKWQGSSTLSSRLRYGTRLNCWKMNPMWSARSRSRSAAPQSDRLWPSNRTWPRVGCSTPPSRPSSVLLPPPLGPSSSTCSPAFSARRWMSRQAVALPGQVKLRSSASSTGVAAFGAEVSCMSVVKGMAHAKADDGSRDADRLARSGSRRVVRAAASGAGSGRNQDAFQRITASPASSRCACWPWSFTTAASMCLRRGQLPKAVTFSVSMAAGCLQVNV